jgi:phosphatidylglycerophosphatase A
MDIIKPFPAGRLQQLRGGMGIMVDDWIAGLYTNIVILVIIIASRAFEYPIYMMR